MNNIMASWAAAHWGKKKKDVHNLMATRSQFVVLFYFLFFIFLILKQPGPSFKFLFF